MCLRSAVSTADARLTGIVASWMDVLDDKWLFCPARVDLEQNVDSGKMRRRQRAKRSYGVPWLWASERRNDGIPAQQTWRSFVASSRGCLADEKWFLSCHLTKVLQKTIMITFSFKQWQRGSALTHTDKTSLSCGDGRCTGQKNVRFPEHKEGMLRRPEEEVDAQQ